MGAVYDEFVQQLEELARRWEGRPHEELLELLLMALEREELVSVAYGSNGLRERLAAMSISAEARDLLARAMQWIAQDEAMHAIWVRGALLRLPELRFCLRAQLQQVTGAVGGWMVAVEQHVPAGRAPLARLLARLLFLVARLLGKTPRAVDSDHLRYLSFRDYCRFNIEAEATAELCWQRVQQMQQQLLVRLPPLALQVVMRIVADEADHRRLFSLFADSFSAQDVLLASEAALVERIREVGEPFLPWRLRRRQDSMLGNGGEVCVESGGEKREALRRVLHASGLLRMLRDRGPDLKVVIKPTFMFAYHRRDRSNFTDPELLMELIDVLWEAGYRRVQVLEGGNLYDRFFAHRSVAEVAAYLGLPGERATLVDSSLDAVPHTYARGLGTDVVSRCWKEADFRIVFGKMRTNPVEVVFNCLAALEGCGPRHDEYLFYERQAHRETPIMMLLGEFPPDFALLDAFDSAADGLAGCIACPRAPSPRRIYAGADILAVDEVAAGHMGVRQVEKTRLLQAARTWFGEPLQAIRVVGTDAHIPGLRLPYGDDLSTLLCFCAGPAHQFGSARGAVFAPEMDAAAFPPLTPPGWWLRAARQAARRLLAIRLPPPSAL
ncbi:MAG: DUF362 domain-containing protein [Candidatus Xenobia bacterium]